MLQRFLDPRCARQHQQLDLLAKTVVDGLLPASIARLISASVRSFAEYRRLYTRRRPGHVD